MLKAENIIKSFEGGARPVLRGVHLEASAGQRVVIMGASGAGKSTLLHILGGLDLPDSGAVELMGEEITRMTETQRARVRNRRVGFVFQFYHLLPDLSVLENVMVPQLILGASRRQAAQTAERMLAEVGLEALAYRRPARLSGGEQQRVGIARALANDPKILFADEPTGNLDEATGGEIIQMLWRQAGEHGRTVVMVAHEKSIALQADRILRLENGVLKEEAIAG
ncbi:MAG: ABC transporter ATP-binding protein [Candidatus Sumerlaeota bacterium]|nr:ABC transporter ATP-binding protein [Candidatus Sumerlaeota bacterium]